ncbi:hypothetical protein [Desulforamulus ruminis]|uniref:Uncharacterized protein n=1 Tax=Desulforamulus ruminis (strain ATCC 23193 / DSM 2154 / NCIMB 8452 / DL) TaxID=696281 RepID=F6DUU1_DESRL|nr:hypothetical protein [Desulforamulus ruminis]AEG60229.1 hypothetical protein Desru_1973 [Desulforamulus ruminis DSM 2154]
MKKLIVAFLSVMIVALAFWVLPNVTFDIPALMELILQSGKKLL